jgi:hypothetical protein
MWSPARLEFFFRGIWRDRAVIVPVHGGSRGASLDRNVALNRIDSPSGGDTRRAMSGSAQQFEEVIGGRTVRIEVSPVTGTPLRWRAELQRAAGGPSAMMPFYGQTPDEAVQSLSRWLALVYAPAITTS